MQTQSSAPIRSFRDANGREWTRRLTIADARRLRAAGVDLLDLTDDAPIDRVPTDPYLLVQILADLFGPQVEAAKLGPDYFDIALAGESWGAAAEWLQRTIADFFPPQRRDALHRLLDAAAKLRARQTEGAVSKAVAAADGLTEESPPTPGGDSPSSPASSDSIPPS